MARSSAPHAARQRSGLDPINLFIGQLLHLIVWPRRGASDRDSAFSNPSSRIPWVPVYVQAWRSSVAKSAYLLRIVTRRNLGNGCILHVPQPGTHASVHSLVFCSASSA